MTAPIAAPPTDFTVFLPFTKVAKLDDGSIRVHSVINDETVDDQGEILDYAGTKAALDDFMKWANVREMHQPSAVGVVESITHDDLARVSEGVLHIVDPVAVTKVEAGVYKGTSLGGSKGALRVMEKVAGQKVTRLKAPVVNEVSVVDRPSRPTAVMTLLKRAQEDDMPPPETTPETTPDEAPADDLAKGTAPATAAPEAGTDVYTDATGAPVDAAAPAPEPTPPAEPLAKSAADDVMTIHIVAESLDRLIEAEAGEPDQVAILRQMRELASRFEAAESAEVGTPADVAEAAAEDVATVTTVTVTATDSPMYYAAKPEDLAKLAEVLAPILAERLAKGDTVIIPADATPPPAAAPAEETPVTADDLLAKVTTLLDERFARFVTPADLDAMKGELLGPVTAMQGELTKIARMPVPGGPLRFAVDADRFAEDAKASSAVEAEVLAKAAQATSDPHLREELGRLAAAAQIAADRRT